MSSTTHPSQTIPDDAGRRGAVAVIVRQQRLLVIRRAQQVVAPLAYCFPGGGVEAHENEEQALVRELFEELGVHVLPIRRLWQSVTPWKVQLAWWLSDLDPRIDPVPNPAEVESFCWCTPDEMRRLPGLLESNWHFLDAWDSGAFALPIPAPSPRDPNRKPAAQ